MDEKIRLLKFLNVFMIGGTEQQFVSVVQRLDRSKFDLHLGCFRKYGAFLPEIEATGHRLTDFAISRLYGLKTFYAQIQFARYLREHRIQVLHTYGLYPNIFAIPAARMAGVPVTIASVRDMGAHTDPIKLGLQRIACRMATRVVVNANAVRHWLAEQGIAEEKIDVVHNGVACAPKRETSDLSIREEFGIPSDAPIVGAICRLNPIKGVNYLVEAAGLLRDRFPEARFIILGDGEAKSELAQRFKELGLESRAILTGFRTDTHRFLREFDVSVLPSLTEGLSNTVMESMAAGIPVVATRVGGTPEIVVDGVTGFLVEPRDVSALVRSITTLLENRQLARQMGEASRRHILEQFSMDRAVHRLEDLYSGLLSPRRKQAA